MKIIHRYVLREHVGPFVFALTALTSLLLLNYIAKQIGQLMGKGLGADVIGRFFLLSIPFTVAMTMPMSVLVATLYAFSRLAAENEITAMKANGVSLGRLLVPVLLAASLVSIGMVAFNDLVLPASNHELRTLQGDIARKKPTFGLREQIINQIADRQVYLKAMHLTSDNRMTDVTIYDLSDVGQRRTVYADSGELAFTAGGSDLLLTLYHGSTLTIPRTEPERLERLRFETNWVIVKGVANSLEMTTSDSYKSDREMSICELQNDISRYEREYEQARRDFAEALRSVVHEGLTGIPADPPQIAAMTMLNVSPGATAPRSTHASLGRAYCDMTLWIKRRMTPAAPAAVSLVPSLYAAELPPQGATPARPVPAPVTQAVPDSAAPADPLSAVAATRQTVVRQMPTTLGTVVENGRTRLRDNLRFVNQSAVELHKKFAISVACTVFVLVGAPIALRFPRGGVGLVIGVSLVIFGIYYVGLIAGEALADRNVLTPFEAMWAANILLTAVGAVLLFRMGRETATSRGGDFGEMIEIVAGLFRGRPTPAARRRTSAPTAPVAATDAPSPVATTPVVRGDLEDR